MKPRFQVEILLKKPLIVFPSFNDMIKDIEKAFIEASLDDILRFRLY